MIMINRKPWMFILWLFTLMVIAFMSACTPNPTVIPTESVVTQATLAITETTVVTPTPTLGMGLPTILLVSDSQANPFALSQTRSALEGLIVEGEQTLDFSETLTPEMITDNVSMVVGVGPTVDLAGFAASAPETVFVAIDNPQAIPGANLSVIGDPIVDQQRQSFMAGYLAALVSSDFKVAALIPSDNPQSDQMVDSFVIGVRFFCGICKPLYPPYNVFPQWEILSIEDASDGFQPIIDTLVINGVEVLYVPEMLYSDALFSYLAEVGVLVVGDHSPALPRNNWVGTVISDPGPALVSLWPNLTAGSQGSQVPASIGLTDTESGLFSEGRRFMFDQMVEDLQAGLVFPQSVP